MGQKQMDLSGVLLECRTAFSPSGARLAIGHGDGTVSLWDPDTGERRHTLALGPAPGKILQLAFLTEQHLATVNANGTLYVLQLPDPGSSSR